MSEYIQTSQNNRTLTITLTRHNKKNAFTSDMYLSLENIFREIATRDDLNSVVITGGEDFSAGNDLVDFLENPPEDETAPPFRFMLALQECPIPVIAAVNGFAVGIGTTLLLHCDLAYATENTVFMLPFINLALPPEFASTLSLPLLAGHVKASELLLLGEKFDAETALQMGLINKICTTETLSETAQKAAEKLATKSRDTLIQTKKLLRRDIEPVKDRIIYEAREFSSAVASPLAREAIDKILKR